MWTQTISCDRQRSVWSEWTHSYRELLIYLDPHVHHFDHCDLVSFIFHCRSLQICFWFLHKIVLKFIQIEFFYVYINTFNNLNKLTLGDIWKHNTLHINNVFFLLWARVSSQCWVISVSTVNYQTLRSIYQITYLLWVMRELLWESWDGLCSSLEEGLGRQFATLDLEA